MEEVTCCLDLWLRGEPRCFNGYFIRPYLLKSSRCLAACSLESDLGPLVSSLQQHVNTKSKSLGLTDWSLCAWFLRPGIWKKPVPKDLQVGFAALLQSVRHINVALVKCGAWKQARTWWMSWRVTNGGNPIAGWFLDGKSYEHRWKMGYPPFFTRPPFGWDPPILLGCHGDCFFGQVGQPVPNFQRLKKR